MLNLQGRRNNSADDSAESKGQIHVRVLCSIKSGLAESGGPRGPRIRLLSPSAWSLHGFRITAIASITSAASAISADSSAASAPSSGW